MATDRRFRSQVGRHRVMRHFRSRRQRRRRGSMGDRRVADRDSQAQRRRIVQMAMREPHAHGRRTLEPATRRASSSELLGISQLKARAAPQLQPFFRLAPHLGHQGAPERFLRAASASETSKTRCRNVMSFILASFAGNACKKGSSKGSRSVVALRCMTTDYCHAPSDRFTTSRLSMARPDPLEPPHPGSAVRHDCLEPLGLTVTQGAKVLGVCRQALNNLVDGRAGIPADMALRLSKAFSGNPETWLCLQVSYDLAQARKTESTLRVLTVADVRRQQQPRLL